MVSIGLIHRLPPRKNANNTSAAVRMRSLPLSEINLRARSTADNRQIGQMPTKERGMKAAHDVLIGTLSPEDSKSKWQVNSDCLMRYYRKLLQACSGRASSSSRCRQLHARVAWLRSAHARIPSA